LLEPKITPPPDLSEVIVNCKDEFVEKLDVKANSLFPSNNREYNIPTNFEKDLIINYIHILKVFLFI
jgi:hypothetical protein